FGRAFLSRPKRAARLAKRLAADADLRSDLEQILEAELARALFLSLLVDRLAEHLAHLARRELLRGGRALLRRRRRRGLEAFVRAAGAQELVHRREAILGILRERAQDDVLDGGRHARFLERSARCSVGEHGGHRGERVASAPREPPGQELVRDDAPREL